MRVCYNEVCAYSCFRIHPVTGSSSVDHMAPKSRAWDQVYEWHNYRLASLLMNARKSNFEDVIDPCEPIDGWFQLELVGFQVKPSRELASSERAAVLHTVARLGLNEPVMLKARESDAETYWAGEISFSHLRRESPFVARELERQGRS